MKLWICDSRAKERWSTWTSNLPPGWQFCLVEDTEKVPKESPSLLVIHDGDGWTWMLPSEFPNVQTVRYTGAPQEVVRHPSSGHPICSLDYLQTRLSDILRAWEPSTVDAEWLFEALSNTPLEVALQLLHALLPRSIDPTMSLGEHEKAWDALTSMVVDMKDKENFSSVLTSFENVKNLYKRCLESRESYTEDLSGLRDALLSDTEPVGLIDTIARSWRA
jgi:hypothetical protein